MDPYPNLTTVEAMHSWEGSQPAVLALHGFTGGGQDFAPLAQRCSYRFIAPDLPGHRDASSPPSEVSFSLPSWARSLSAVVNRETVVLGYSMGARLALELACSIPLGGLILISGTAGIRDDIERSNRRAQDQELADHIESTSVTQFLDEWARKPIIASQQRASQTIKDLIRSTREHHTSSGLAHAVRRCGTGSMTPLWSQLPKIICPTLLITGSEDPKFEGLAVELSESLSNATHVSVTGSGHAPHFEDPDAVAVAITEFLKNVN